MRHNTDKINLQEEQTNTTELSKFNSASDILQTVGYLKYKATEYYRKGDIVSYYFEWQQIRIQVEGRMDDETYKYFLNIERKVSFALNNLPKNQGYKKLLILFVEKYVRELQLLIEKWGMGTINKEDEIHFA